MVQADLSGINYFLPLLSFFLVFVIMYAVIVKTKLVEHWFLQIFIPFVLATIFVSAVGARDYVLNIVVWFAVLLVSFFLLLMMSGFAGEHLKSWNKGIGILFIILVIVMFLISAVFVFSEYFTPYLPGSSGAGANPDVLRFTDWVYSPRVSGAILLIIVSALVSWVLVKGAGKKEEKKK